MHAAVYVNRLDVGGIVHSHQIFASIFALINEQVPALFDEVSFSLGEVIEFCGGLTGDAARMIAGGPMMGFAFSDLATPVTKGTSGVTVLTHEDVRREKETSCVRCGRCVDACPMKLVPTRLAMAARYGKASLAERHSIMACFECGCCTYVCPANIKLVQLIRTGKAQIAAARKN